MHTSRTLPASSDQRLAAARPQRRWVRTMAKPKTSATQALDVVEASDLRSAPSSSGKLLFFTHTLCPYAQRVWIALQEKEVPYTLVHVDLSDKPAWFRSVNPRGLVPAVQYDGQTVTESTDICRWLDGQFSSGSRLVPEQPAARQLMQRGLSSSESIISAGLDFAAGSNGRYWGIGSKQSPSQVAQLSRALGSLEALLAQSGGPFLAGQQVSLADVVLLPFIERFEVIAAEVVNCPVPGLTDKQVPVNNWLVAMQQRASCQVACAPRARLAAALRQHMSLDFFDYSTYRALDVHG